MVFIFPFGVASLQKCFWGVVSPEGLCLGTAAGGTHLQGEVNINQYITNIQFGNCPCCWNEHKALRFLLVAGYLKIFKQTNPRPTKPPTMFLPLFWTLWVYLWSFPAAEDHRSKCSFRASKSLWNISLQLPFCAGTSQQLQKRLPWSSFLVVFFSSWLLFPYICMAGQFFLSPILYFSLGAPCSVEGRAQQSWLERTVWVLALCSLLPQTLFEAFAFLCILSPLGVFPLLEW